LAQLARGAVREVAQDAAGVTYAKKISVDDARIDWSKPAEVVLRQIHGLNPVPGAWTMIGENRLKILRVLCVPGSGAPGTAIDGTLGIACGEGALRVQELQRAGRGVQNAEEFLRGFPVAAGARFG
jgi:methionyl-tRNA formyltransferase